MRKIKYKPIEFDRCNTCPLFNFYNERSYCRFDFQHVYKKGEGPAGGIYRPKEKCRVEEITIKLEEVGRRNEFL